LCLSCIIEKKVGLKSCFILTVSATMEYGIIGLIVITKDVG
jgi:hypothetical protein